MSLSINLVPHKSRPHLRSSYNSRCQTAVTYDVIVSWWYFSNDSLDGRDSGEKFSHRVLVNATSEGQAREFIMKSYNYDSTRIESIGLL